ncbi:hypothetical protein GGR58DRAFT_527773 [Xylaria digitata]|nr:hypothetical protein GGR58DRAFT_527773 [Xylaria digitata]
MSLATVEQLRQNDNYVYGDSTRYTVFERGDNLKETTDPPSLLLLLRNINFDASNPNIDRIVNQIRQALGNDGSGIRRLDFDLVRGERRTLWGNNNAQSLLNQANAAVLKVQSLITKYEDRKEATNTETWLIQAMINSLAFNYTDLFGSQRETFDEILKWVRRHISARFRHMWQTNKMDEAGLNRPHQLEIWGTDINRQIHEGALLEDAVLALSGRLMLLFDTRPGSSPPRQRELEFRSEQYRTMFQNIYFYSVEEAMALGEYVFRAEVFAPFRHTLTSHLLLDVYGKNRPRPIFPAKVRVGARPEIQPIWIACRNLRHDVLIALNQRKMYGGITAYIWGRIRGKADILTNLVRALESVPYLENDGQPLVWTIRFQHWTKKYKHPPSLTFPGIREPPELTPEATATNVPPEHDGGGPDAGDGGDGGNGGGGDSDNDDDNDDGNDNAGGNTNNNNNNDNVDNDVDDDDDDDDDEDRDSHHSGDEDSHDSDGDGDGGGGGGGGAAGGNTGGGLGGGGGGGRGGNVYVPPGRRPGGGVPAGPWMNRNWRDRSSATVCERCVHISAEQNCPTCGGDSIPLYPAVKGTKRQMKLKRAQENDTEIDPPNKRMRSFLASQAILDKLSDQLRKAKIDVREGPGNSMETTNFNYPDSFKQRGPEFQLPPQMRG